MQPDSRSITVGWVLALTATAAFSTNAPVARGAILAGMDPATLLAARFVLATLLFGSVLAFSGMRRTAPAQRPLDRAGILYAAGSGLTNGLALMSFFWGLTLVSASVASMISIALAPIFTLLLLRSRGELITGRSIVRLGLSLVGIYFLVGLGGAVDPWGVLLLISGAFFFALHLVSVQWYLRPYNTLVVTAIMVVAACSMVLPFWWLTGADPFIPLWIGWIAIFAQGIVATFIARLMTYVAINRIGSGQFALLTPLEALLTILWSALFLAERLAPAQWIGAVLIVISTLLAADVGWRLFGRLRRRLS